LLRCELCPTLCELGDYQVGACRVRINKDGKLYSLVYGRPCSANIDPIEKKPFFHFLPATTVFSIATAGCTLACKFCQNWQISQASPEDTDNLDMPPEKVVELALAQGCRTIAYTYTEPTVFYEYMLDTAKLAKEAGIKNTVHTCGYINPAPLKELLPYIDAANVDLKSMDDGFYDRICGGRLKPVLDSLVIMKEAGLWLELTNLVVPTLNDSKAELDRLAGWVADNLGPDTPLHFSRFFPLYKLTNLPPTPPDTLEAARKAGIGAGLRYVYVGNISGMGEDTSCPRCKRLLVERTGYFVKKMDITGGRCRHCGERIAGVWA
jgi:pyruvate formate lyase activating enzyme